MWLTAMILGEGTNSARDWEWSGPLVNYCSVKSIQKQIQLQKSTIPAQTAKKGLSVFELLITLVRVIPANICEPVAGKPLLLGVVHIIQHTEETQ